MTRTRKKPSPKPENPEKFRDPFVLVYFDEDESYDYFNVVTEIRKKRVQEHESNQGLLYVKYNKAWFLGKIVQRAGN